MYIGPMSFARDYYPLPLHMDENYAKSTVFANDVLIGKATIKNLVKRNEKNGLAEVTIDIYNQDGVLVLKDVTEVIVKCQVPQK